MAHTYTHLVRPTSNEARPVMTRDEGLILMNRIYIESYIRLIDVFYKRVDGDTDEDKMGRKYLTECKEHALVDLQMLDRIEGKENDRNDNVI